MLSILMVKDKTLVVGIGNNLRQDDGIGPAVIEYLQQQPEKLDADFLNGGIDPLNLIEPLSQYKHAILIDAAHMQKPAGSVVCFDLNDAKLHIKANVLSTHGIGLIELIELLGALDITLKLTIIAIEPADISLGEGLTETVKAKLPEIVKLVKQQIDSTKGEMEMGKIFYISEIIAFAIEKEKESYSLYKQLAEQVTDKGIQVLFGELMMQEKHHEEIYEDMLKTVEKQQSTGVSEDHEYVAYMRELIATSRTTPSLSDLDLNDIHAVLNFAIAREKDSILFYLGLKNFVESNMQEYIDTIIKEETKHVTILTKIKKMM